MSEIANPNLSGVLVSTLIPLYLRAMISQHPDALMKDDKADTLVAQMSYDFAKVRQIPMMDGSKVMRIMLTRKIGRYVWDFMERHPDSTYNFKPCNSWLKYII